MQLTVSIEEMLTFVSVVGVCLQEEQAIGIVFFNFFHVLRFYQGLQVHDIIFIWITICMVEPGLTNKVPHPVVFYGALELYGSCTQIKQLTCILINKIISI